MQLPIYDSHFLIGFPVLIGLALETYSRYRKSGNISTLYISLTSLFLGISSFFWGVPSLFTTDPKTLSFFTLLGDISQAFMFLMLWLLAIRAFLSTNKLHKTIGYVFAYSITIIAIADSIRRFLTTPYTTYIEEISSTAYDIIFIDAPLFFILAFINSLSFILLGVYFWRSARSATSSTQRFRIKAVSVIFMLGSLVYIVIPAIQKDTNLNLDDKILSVIYIIAFIILLISYISRIRSTNSPTASIR